MHFIPDPIINSISLEIYLFLSFFIGKNRDATIFFGKKICSIWNYFEPNNISFYKNRIFNQTSISHGFKKKLKIKSVLYPMRLKRRKSKIKLEH